MTPQTLTHLAVAGRVPHATGIQKTVRVCHIMSADLWAGAEVQLATMAAYLVEQQGVSLTAVLFNEGPLARELRCLGVPVTVVDECRTGAIGIVRFLARFLSEHDIDLVHTHRYKDNVLGTIAAKLAGVPHVIRTVHGLREPMTGWNRLKFRVYEALDQATLRYFADLVIAVSKDMADTLRASGYRRTMVTHIHNGVDLGRVTPRRRPEEVREELGVDPRAILIGTAGRLSPVKGHAGLLRAARLILKHAPDATFLVVGGGPLKAELLASAITLQVDGACLFPGPRTDVLDLISAMDIFILPSLNEGIPMAMLEAMALGKPVVATAVGGVPEVVRHRVTGLLVEPGDERALAEACLELARDREWAQRLGARARRVVHEEFSHERMGQGLVDAYRRVAQTGDRLDVFTHTSRPSITALGFCSGLIRKLGEWGMRRVRHAIERRRMTRLRDNPTAVRMALRSARSLLIVCHGNIIRSPFAARLISQSLGKVAPLSVTSAGLEAVPGRPPHPTALLTATARRIDLSRHTAARVEAERVAKSDAIFVMDIPQLLAMRQRFPDARGKTFLLTCLAPDAPLEIGDPVEGDEAVFQSCFEDISRAARPIVRILGGAMTAR